MKVVAAGIGLVFSAALLGAAPAGTCSQDTFAIDGASLSVAICPKPGAHDAPALEETLSVKGQPALVRELPLDVVSSSETAHAIDDVPLAKLGLSRTLHIAVAYKAGAVKLEHALLLPGAISLK